MMFDVDRPNKKNSEHGSLFFVRRLLLLTSMFLLACQPNITLVPVTFSGLTMGTDYRITIIATSDQALSQLENDIVDELELVDRSMSTYRSDSEVSSINLAKENELLEISESLRLVLTEANEISQLTNGAFDITLGPIVDLWGFGPQGSIEKRPDKISLNALRVSIGYSKLRLNDKGLSKTNSATQIDLSGIAKGFAVDQVARLLTRNGHANYLIEIGGELRAKGKSLAGQPWRVGIEKPQEIGGIQKIVVLNDQAIATSGDYRNYILIDGKKYSHTIDHITIEPVLHKLALVSVVSTNASTADALATALMSMGDEDAVLFAQKNKIAAYFVIRTLDDGYDIKISEQFNNIVQ